MSDQTFDEFRQAVAEMTNVPAALLANGDTTEQIWDLARSATEWKAAAQPPRPATAAVSASVVTSADTFQSGSAPQIQTHSELQRLSPAERMRAYREGRLSALGANPGQPRRIGLSGAPTNRVP
jgi:hypothetical protein